MTSALFDWLKFVKKFLLFRLSNGRQLQVNLNQSYLRRHLGKLTLRQLGLRTTCVYGYELHQLLLTASVSYAGGAPPAGIAFYASKLKKRAEKVNKRIRI